MTPSDPVTSVSARPAANRHRDLDGVFHGVLDQCGDLFALAGSDLHHEFVMDLHDDAAVHAGVLQRLLGTDHGDLHDVRRRALDGRVQRGAFRSVPRRAVGGFQGREIPAPAEHRFGVSIDPSPGHQ